MAEKELIFDIVVETNKAVADIKGMLAKTEAEAKKSGSKAGSEFANSFKAGVSAILTSAVIISMFSSLSGAIKEYSSGVFNSALNTEYQAQAFTNLTGSVEKSKKLFEDINKLSLETPFNVDDLRQIAKSMLSYGIALEDVIPTTKMLGDISAGTGGDLLLLAKAYGQVKTKGKLYAQELNQLGEQGLAVREILANKLGVSIENLMKGLETGKITVDFQEFSDVIQGIHKGKFLDFMAKQAVTAKGRMQNLGEQLNLVGQEILGIDTATGKIKPDSLFDRMTKSLAETLDFINRNKEAIIQFGSSMADKLGQAIDMVIKGFSWMRENKDLVIGGITGLGTAITISLLPALGGLIALMSPFLLLASALVGLGVAFAWLQRPENFEKTSNILGELKNNLFDLWKQGSETLNKFVETLKKNFAPEIEVVKSIIGSLATIWESWLFGVKGLMDSLAPLGVMLLWLGANVLQMLFFAFEVLREPIGELLKVFFELVAVLSQFLFPLVGQLIQFFSILASTLSFLLMPAFQILFAFVVRFFEGLVDILRGIVGVIAGILNVLFGIVTLNREQIMRGFMQMWEGLVNFVRGAFELVLSPFRGVIDGIINTFKSVNLFQLGVDMINGLIDGIGSKIGEVKSLIGGVGNFASDGINNIKNNIPKFAKGGDFIVPDGYPNDSYLMRVQSRERVIVQTPTQQNQNINSNNNINYNNYGNKEDNSTLPFMLNYA